MPQPIDPELAAALAFHFPSYHPPQMVAAPPPPPPAPLPGLYGRVPGLPYDIHPPVQPPIQTVRPIGESGPGYNGPAPYAPIPDTVDEAPGRYAAPSYNAFVLYLAHLLSQQQQDQALSAARGFPHLGY